MIVILTHKAQMKLDNLLEYYKRIGYPGQGKKLRARILKKALILQGGISIGPIEENLAELGLGHRYLVAEKNYKIIYRSEGNNVFITDIFDTRQDPEKMSGD